MKITAMTATVLRSYEYPHGGWVLVRVRTGDGLEGIGECFVPHDTGSAVFAAKEIIDRSLAPVVLGADALDIQPLWERMYQVGRNIYDRRGLAIHAISGIDMALHDAAAKTLGVPLCRLLGGCHRDRVRVYVSSIYVDPELPDVALESSRYYASQGYTAIKYYGWPGFGADLGRDADLLERIGEAVGQGVEIMLDLGRPDSLSQAIRIARMLERCGANVRWWEEPFSSTDHVESLAALAQRTDLTIAAGEAELTAFAFRDLILKRAVDLLQPDLSWVGGPTEGKRIAELARLFNIPLVPHNWGTMVNTAASIHLVAAMPAGFLCEYPITARTPKAALTRTPSPMMTELATKPIVVERGFARVPQEPGLGIELDEDIVRQYTCSS
jgi:L-alanine-DL-glutamate epimerase-like enolase superfamily enzyme